MIFSEEIGFENELQENISIEDIRKEYNDGIIIWLNGSGASQEGKMGAYRCVLDYKGHVKFIEKQLPEATANQSMITGAIDAVQCVNKSVRIYLITPTALGFATAFKGKGTNSVLIQQLYEIIKQKNCQLTEVQFINGGDAIKKFVFSCNPDKTQINLYEKQREKKQENRMKYKEMVYQECLEKVAQILRKNAVDTDLIEAIREIRP